MENRFANLPGLNFTDKLKVKHHVSQILSFNNGYRKFGRLSGGVDSEILKDGFEDVCSTGNQINFDPILTYGCIKKPPSVAFRPHFVIYDKKILRFYGYCRQRDYDSSNKTQIRYVNIMYFLEDDTITVMEPIVNNSGFPQGRLVRRSKICKNSNGSYYTWKDFNIGIDIDLNGILFHITDCDEFTTEYLLANGVELNERECLPQDPSSQDRLNNRIKFNKSSKKTTPSSADNKLKKFLDFSNKVLQFDCVFDDTDTGELITFKLFYHLEDDSISIKELKVNQEGRDRFSMFLRRTKLPKNWKKETVEFPGLSSSTTEMGPQENYTPQDLIVGSTILVYGRKFVLLDCDYFTRNYFENILRISQPMKLDLPKKSIPDIKIKIPEYLGLGTPEDSLASCYNLVPRAPKTDIITYLLNANKVLRYGCKMDTVVDLDKDREFILIYNLTDGTLKIMEIAVQNSGRAGGKFLSSTKLAKPDSNKNKPDYYTPRDLFLGAKVQVYSHRFIITSADLYVYKYMKSHPEHFSTEVINNLRMYHLKKGTLSSSDSGIMEYIKEQEGKERIRKSSLQELPEEIERRIPDPQITEDEVKKFYHDDQDLSIPCNIDTGPEPIIPSDQGVVKFKEDYES